ncbi:MAG: HAMP domain-containing protein [Caldilinea sp. CFX5]|nr:HAMP domain-containing protein [Caldilinea sp. CFX5]
MIRHRPCLHKLLRIWYNRAMNQLLRYCLSYHCPLCQRLLRMPLFYKLLLANSAIVMLGAVAGTVITVWHVQTYPADIHYPLIVLFSGAGLVISFVVNHWVLQRALAPLDRLQSAVDAIRRGVTQVRVDPGLTSDDRFDRLAETFNQMVARLEANAQRLQQLSRQILQAQEEERHRLARELHDEAAQALTSLLVHLRLLERAHTPAEAQQRVQELRVLTAQALEEVRRVALDLRPTILDDLGLGPALAWRVDEFNTIEGMHATIAIHGLEQRLPRDVELVFYRVGQEALSNVVRHAQARQVTVNLQRIDGQVTLEVSDDGQGFDPTAVRGNNGQGFGLLGMRERMGMIDGELTIVSTLGAGTQVVARAPVQ